MKECFAIREGSLVPVSPEEGASIVLYAAPEAQETTELLEKVGIDRYDFDSALDAEEISRVEFAEDRISLIWKRPRQVSVREALRFDVSSSGFFLHQSRLTIIAAEDAGFFSAADFQGVNSPIDVMLKYFFHTVRHYMGHLKVIRQITADLESKISTSMENRYLLQMFALGESLTYYLSAIEANGAVLAKLAGNGERIRLSRQQMEFLSDISLENTQCARQAQIYSAVLSGLMDARGTIINNNMNMLLKNLTLINVVFLPLNLIASIGGMSEFSMMTQGVPWQVSYSFFAVGMILFGLMTWLLIVRFSGRNHKARAGAARAARRTARKVGSP